jgi:nicotinamidase-related amidase
MSVTRKVRKFLVGFTAAVFAAAAIAQADLPAPPKSLKAEETAIILVDFQGNFVNPEGAWYGRFKPLYDKTRMLERVVEMVKAARAKGVWVIHVTEGYSQDYRELDSTNPGAFHRNQIARNAWKIGSKEAAYYEPLRPAPKDRDLMLAPRIQASGFGGTGLNEILRSKGIRNVAVGGFTTDVCVYATVLSAYDLGYRVYALREAMAGFYPEMSEDMLKNVYPFWSYVIGNDDWLKMVEPATGH